MDISEKINNTGIASRSWGYFALSRLIILLTYDVRLLVKYSIDTFQRDTLAARRNFLHISIDSLYFIIDVKKSLGEVGSWSVA